MTDTHCDGYWLSGQNFETRPLEQLWLHWHRDGDQTGFLTAVARGRIRIHRQDVLLPLLADLMMLPGDRWQFWLPQHREDPVDDDWRLLWKHHELMAVHKPACLPVSRTTRNLFETLVGCIRRQTQYQNAHLLHRLDAETSGITLIALDSHCDRKWKKRLDRLLQDKVYLALVDGEPDWQRFHAGHWLAERSDSAIRSRVWCAGSDPEAMPTAADWIKPKWAETAFERLHSHQGQTLIRCQLFSGRRHQIRSQLAALGLPIVGDKIYHHDGAYYLKRLSVGLTEEDWQALGSPHHLLHAWQVRLSLYGESEEIIDNRLSPAWPEWVQSWLVSEALTGTCGS